MSYEVEGRTVLITGAARGIGAETAVRLHGRGANVALVGLERERLEALAARLGDRTEVFEADVVDARALERAVAGTVARFGALDVGIANAGLHFVGAVATASIEQLERELDVNLYGVLRTVRAVLPHVIERRGYVLNVASLAAASHAPLMGSYSASKAGVEALTNCLRVELAPTGARAGCAYFGFIDTDLVRGGLEHPSSRSMERVMPGFVRRPVPVAAAVDAIERGVLGRKARVWAPRYVGGALALRGLLQPLLERRAARDPRIREALELAGPGALAGQDPLLGVAIRPEEANGEALVSATGEER
jgi:NAD(P)-dependent dehydrogenase (short-subunit alcohol dehydrogenase family)